MEFWKLRMLLQALREIEFQSESPPSGTFFDMWPIAVDVSTELKPFTPHRQRGTVLIPFPGPARSMVTS